jgi:hypothetical protein
LSTTFKRGEIIDDEHPQMLYDTDQPIDKVYAGHNCSILSISTNGKLLTIPCVQFSFSNDSTVLSESVKGLVNVIADTVGSVFLPNVT